MNGNIQEWKLSEYEVGFVAVSPMCSSYGALKLHIPKLMPKIPMGPARTTTKSLSGSCFINDNSCKPSIPSTISTQNYITVNPQSNRNFKLPVFRYNAKVIVECRNQNPDSLFLSTKEDNSSAC